MTDPLKLRIVSSIEEAQVIPAPLAGSSGSDDPGVGATPAAESSEGAGGGDAEPRSLDLECSFFPRTDLGNAQRFLRRHGGDFLHVEEWGWLAWDTRRWNTAEAEAILGRAVHQTIKDIALEAAALKESKFDVLLDERKGLWLSDKLKGWGLASQGNAHLACVARLAQSYLTAAPSAFDADPLAMNVGNGTLRFAKVDDGDYVSFHPHNRADRMTKLTEVAFDAAATCPEYDKFLARIQPEIRMVRHLHAWGGLSLTALAVARLSFWYGTGRNGKSTLIDAWGHVMGDYAQTIPIESFLDQGRTRRGGEASPDIASLPGIRCLRTSEPEKGSKLAEGLVKLVTGGEPMRARHLNRDFFEFRPVFKLTMQGNYRPAIYGTDEGMWSRILLVPFGVMIPEAERDLDLPDKLKREASGILNRLLDGLRDYLDHGLLPPAEVLDATAEYRDDSDPVGRFIRDCTTWETDARVGGKEIFQVYTAWCKAHGERVFSHKAFSRGLQDHGIPRLKSSGIWYCGVALTTTALAFQGMEIEEGPRPKT